ncbi:protein phosphatase 1 inhibitor domain-containing protein [Phthorimaea operculella]|nr:protein phosphatase 1 inhibitor domain-containing protein [Phthorimaea operculella]
MNFDDDDDDDEYEPLYANGHWVWDEKRDELKFVNDLDYESHTTTIHTLAVLTAVDFRDDLDIVEQLRFRKRIQRKTTGPDDVVTLQDVKDLVLYLAPVSLVSPTVIKVLHTSSGERFLRAMIMYCQYYLELLEIMEARTVELETKIPTDNSIIVEAQYEENLSDLRLLAAKEYTILIQGADDFFYHHKGKDKKQKTLSKQGTILFEALLRLCVQIVWIALARRQLTQIDLEINRLFRSKKFNLVEHNLDLDLERSMTANQRKVLYGERYNPARTMNVHSPFYDEINGIQSNHNVDFKMLGLGSIKYQKLDARLRYLEALLIMPETMFPAQNLNLGIIGLNRAKYDTMLREIFIPDEKSKSKVGAGSSKTLSGSRHSSKGSSASKKMVMMSDKDNSGSRYYPRLYIPEKTTELQPSDFIEEDQELMKINTRQLRKWVSLVRTRNRRRTRSLSLTMSKAKLSTSDQSKSQKS